ncbi:sulfatase-like hydrolase/transferase [Amycolatopsis sp. EV170708-02-1]|uniref:sulfatase-like hydrolase/transferase n=1 Tax=Amycolatopsis sp. EV170708-02-1 TaxID=2919322 RepID=UPI001F0B9C8E|nr:sulfatase-like hydrolase/transferase [Amycolatopsis sp. EV170708-02-1]UMP01531.1 sulfatase-like hydrolase/transferase [Amycolatopsis sp. EV170708-02-1]
MSVFTRPALVGLPGDRTAARDIASSAVTTLSAVLVLFALLAPNDLDALTPAAFVRLPVEALLGVAVVLMLRDGARRIVAVSAGALLGLLTVFKAIDIGFGLALDRRFNPVFDWGVLGNGVDLLGTSIGRAGAIASFAGLTLLAVVVIVLMALAVQRLSRVVAGRRTASTRVTAVLSVVWMVCAVSGAQLAPGQPLASRSAVAFAYDDLRQVRAGIRDRQAFAEEVAVDAFRDTPSSGLLNALRGKDVLFTFIESYGRVAVQDSDIAPKVDAVLDAGTARLKNSGYGSRSAFLTSPTTSAGSWLAHSTFQSGVWVDSQHRYDDFVKTDRFTLGGAFKRAGWQTVGVVPAHTEDWPEGKVYGYDRYYDSRNIGYRGPPFSYATMPDQFTLSAFQRAERDRNRPPLMAEIDLVTSHWPWTPLPRTVDWAAVGDGSIYNPMPSQGKTPEEVFTDPAKVRGAYGDSIAYSLNSLVSYVETYGDDDLVLVFLGDHQPNPIVAGAGADHDVPITVVTRDKAVLDKVAAWNWQDGLNPDRNAPVWRMDTFRDRFLTAFAR